MESSGSQRSGLLTAGGVLSIVAGAIQIIGGMAAIAALVVGGIMWDRIYPYLPVPWMQGGWPGTFIGPLLGILAVPGLALGIVAIIGGVYALRRKSFGMSLAGAICALPTVILGILAIIFVAASRKEFEGQQ